MKSEPEAQIIKLYIPPDLGLYNREFSEFLSKVHEALNQAEQRNDGRTILCFYQTGSNTDINVSLYDQLYKGTTFDEVYEKLLHVRLLLDRIRNSPCPSVFSSFFDCKGSVFELFLACSYRLNFDEFAQYGFEEILGDFFPCAGSFEELIEQKSPATLRFKSQGTISAKEAAKLNLIQFSINGDDHYGLTNYWLENNTTRVLNDRRRFIRPDREWRSNGITKLSLDRQKIQKLKIDLTTDYCFQNRSPRALSFCENILHNRPKQLNDQEIKALIAYMCARYTLSPRFQSWFRSRIQLPTKYNLIGEKESFTAVFSIYPYVPPAQPLLNALTNGKRLVFYCDSPTQLKNGIDLFAGRLEQQLGRERSLKIIRKQISWLVADEKKILGYKINFETNSQFTVRRENTCFKFYHTLNSNTDHNIHAEFSTHNEFELPSRIRQLLAVFCSNIFITKSPFSLPVPVMTLARSLFLQEIVHLCLSSQQNMESVMESLKVSGWNFVSEASAWERFLRGRQEFTDLSEAELQKSPATIDIDLWRMGLWKEVKSYLKERARPENSTSLGTTFLSRHLMAYVCYIIDKLQLLDLGLSTNELDLLITNAIGVPENYGSRERYTYMWGSQRLNQYIEHHWGKR